MGFLERIERGIRTAVEASFGRVFGGHLRLSELERRVAIELTASERQDDGRSVVANLCLLTVSAGDHKALGPLAPAKLEQAMRAKANAAGWSTLGPFVAELEPAPHLAPGQTDVRMAFHPGYWVVRLDVLSGPDAGRTYESEAQRILIGRARDADLRLSDPDVSRHHCEIRGEGDRVVIADLGSSNGTRLNRRPVSVANLAPQDTVEVGRTLIEVRLTGVRWTAPVDSAAGA